MSFETYWFVFAPGALLALSGIGWAWLWFTRQRAKPNHPPAAVEPLR